MTEDYLHYIWKFSLYNHLDLKTVSGDELSVKKLGIHNFDSGPDFLEARLIIAGTEWAGSVEIHINSSDWNKHRHQYDKAYNNVALHVVYKNDKEIRNQNGELIPILELKDLLDHKHYFNYERFLASKKWIPCEGGLENITSIKINSWLDRVLLERFERKIAVILRELKTTNGNWDEVFYRFIFRYFGMKVNGDAMYELAKRTPFKMILKESKNSTSLEAILFGQAGLLNEEMEIEYHSQLREEYLYQKQKYNLSSLETSQWKFSKLRPPNFPTMRIAQLAMLYSTNQRLFQLIRDKETITLIKEILKTTTSAFWENHYVFGKESNDAKNNVGDMLLNNLLINVVAPISFAYGKSISDYSYIDFALEILENVPSEKNKIVNKWKEIGLSFQSSSDSQTSIELYENYCSQKKCLNCSLGVELLGK